MKLASLRPTGRAREGELILVSRDNQTATRATPLGFSTLRSALENWSEAKPVLQREFERLCIGKATETFALKLEDCAAPIRNAPGFYDGSAFLSHVVRARKARGDEMPASAKITPLMYQGVSDQLLSWNDPMPLIDPAFGGDFEGEFAVITDDTPRGVTAAKAEDHIALIALFNDITLREVLKTEIETKFGFLQSKPNSSFAPLVVTPDEVGSAWKDGRLCLDLEVEFNGSLFGRPNGSEMHFSFGALIAHAARTRPLSAGSIVGSGTVSNEDKSRGFACLTEKRFQEILDTGKPSTPWLKSGDRVTMDVRRDGASVFGRIDEKAI